MPHKGTARTKVSAAAHSPLSYPKRADKRRQGRSADDVTDASNKNAYSFRSANMHPSCAYRVTASGSQKASCIR